LKKNIEKLVASLYFFMPAVYTYAIPGRHALLNHILDYLIQVNAKKEKPCTKVEIITFSDAFGACSFIALLSHAELYPHLQTDRNDRHIELH
jgi:hypothetical protein